MTDLADQLVREVAAMHVRRTPRYASGCRECGQLWPCSTARVLAPLTTPTEETNGG